MDVCFVAAGAGCSRKCSDVGTGPLPIGPAKTQRFEMWLTEACESVLWGQMPLSFTHKDGDAEQAENRVRSGAGVLRACRQGGGLAAAARECAELLRAARRRAPAMETH